MFPSPTHVPYRDILPCLLRFFKVAGASTLCHARGAVHRPGDKSSNPSAAVSFPIPWLPAALSLHPGPLEMHPGVDRACILTCRVQQPFQLASSSVFRPIHESVPRAASNITDKTCWRRCRHLLQLRCHAVPGASGFIGSQFPGDGRSHLKPAAEALIECTENRAQETTMP